jgi:hypothetical protein
VATIGTGDSNDDAAAGAMTGPMAAAGSEAGTMVGMAAARGQRRGGTVGTTVILGTGDGGCGDNDRAGGGGVLGGGDEDDGGSARGRGRDKCSSSVLLITNILLFWINLTQLV